MHGNKVNLLIGYFIYHLKDAIKRMLTKKKKKRDKNAICMFCINTAILTGVYYIPSEFLETICIVFETIIIFKFNREK